jgi:myo-inositol-1-phosphate synthase
VPAVQHYRDAADDAYVPGIVHARLGGYHIRDIEFTLGIDISATKVEAFIRGEEEA